MMSLTWALGIGHLHVREHTRTTSPAIHEEQAHIQPCGRGRYAGPKLKQQCVNKLQGYQLLDRDEPDDQLVQTETIRVAKGFARSLLLGLL